MRRRLAFVLLTLVSSSRPIHGWGCAGHHVVAMIAERRLNPRALAAVNELLEAEPIDPTLSRFCRDGTTEAFVSAATWPDDVKRAEGTGTWHYIDVPRAIAQGDLNQYCEAVGPPSNGSRPGCLLTALRDQLAILKSGKRADRARALRYVIHLVGDLHQPLHVNDNGDRGGNCVPVRFGPELAMTNLHTLWDSGILDAELSRRHIAEKEYAMELDARYQQDFEHRAGEPRTLDQWIWDVHEIGVRVAYAKLRPPVPVHESDTSDDCTAESARIRTLNIVIGADYQRSAMEAIERLLALAGYRLAELLNQVWP